MRRDLGEALELAASDDDVRVIIITGAGEFSEGGDVSDGREMEREDADEFARMLGAGRAW